eukprot:761660-Hanusia_phi.AAC.2
MLFEDQGAAAGEGDGSNHALDILEEIERRNPWSTAQELMEMVENEELKMPEETLSNFRRLINLYERSIDHERILEITSQGLQLERDIFLAKLREIDDICAMGLQSGIETTNLEAHVLMNAQEVLHSESNIFVVKQDFV